MCKGLAVEDETTSGTAGPVAHNNVALFTARSAEELERVVAHPELRGLVWHRLDETHALVDPTSVRLFHERLAALGIALRVGELSS